MIKPKRLFPIALIVLLILCGWIWSLGDSLTRASNSDVPAPAPPARFVRIYSTDGVVLAGSYWPAADHAPAVLLLHGNASNRGAMRETAAWLNAQGYAVLTVDLRGHGQSTPARMSFGLHEADDARAALDWLRRADPGGRVGVVGFSLGGAASLIGRQGPLPVDALALVGVYPDIRHAIFDRLSIRLGPWLAAVAEPFLSFQSLPRLGVWPSSLSPLRALAQVQAPVMIVGGEADADTPPAETRALYDAVKGERELRMLAGVGHNELGRLPEGMRKGLLSFLDRNLKAGPP